MATYTIKPNAADFLTCDLDAIRHVYTYEEVCEDASNFEMPVEVYIDQFMDVHED